MATSRRRTVSLVGALVGGLVALAIGFGAGFYTRSATTTTTTSTSTTTTSSSSTTSTTTVPLAHCVSHELTATESPLQGAAGTVEVTFQVTNASAAACRLLGFPRLQLLAANGTAIPTDTVAAGTHFSVAAANAPAAAQRLAPGASATFVAQYSQIPTGTEQTCPTSDLVDVFPPGQALPVRVAAQLMPCDNGLVHVSPFYGAT